MAAITAAVPAVPARPRFVYIVNPWYDWAFFVGAPILALVVSFVINPIPALFRPVGYLGLTEPWAAAFINIWTYAHLVAVVFRSHGNPQIFQQFRFRFIGVPILLAAAFTLSTPLLALGLLLAILWDVYHTSMQNFGFCRIYDAKVGNSPQLGRNWDIWMNHFIYIGPIFLGRAWAAHLAYCANQLRVAQWNNAALFVENLVYWQPYAEAVVVYGFVAFFIGYLIHFRYLFLKNGYRISNLKILVLLSTAITSVIAWAYTPPLQAFFVVNLFHGLQYFAIVWWSEGKNIRRWIKFPVVALAAYVAFVFSFGLLYDLFGHSPGRYRFWAGMFLVVSLMHFWYDGFVWSVRKKQV